MILTLMALLIVFLGLIFLFIYRQKSDESVGWEATVACLLIIGGLCLVICSTFISIKEIRAGNEIAKIEAIRNTFETARINQEVHPLELAAIQQKAIDKNEWIASAKYWANHPLTNWFWSKRILEIEPIK